jgi:hypothetical protein
VAAECGCTSRQRICDVRISGGGSPLARTRIALGTGEQDGSSLRHVVLRDESHRSWLRVSPAHVHERRENKLPTKSAAPPTTFPTRIQGIRPDQEDAPNNRAVGAASIGRPWEAGMTAQWPSLPSLETCLHANRSRTQTNSIANHTTAQGAAWPSPTSSRRREDAPIGWRDTK